MKPATAHEWTKFLRFFGEQNAGKPTRLGVFERSGDVMNDFWIENGLPLASIDIDTIKELPSIQIRVDNFTHEVTDAVKLVFHFSLAGDEDGIDIPCANGQTTILRFENKSEARRSL